MIRLHFRKNILIPVSMRDEDLEFFAEGTGDAANPFGCNFIAFALHGVDDSFFLFTPFEEKTKHKI